MWLENHELQQQPLPRRPRIRWARSAAEAADPASELLPVAEERHRGDTQADALLARRLQMREEAVAAHRLAASQRAEAQARHVIDLLYERQSFGEEAVSVLLPESARALRSIAIF